MDMRNNKLIRSCTILDNLHDLQLKLIISAVFLNLALSGCNSKGDIIIYKEGKVIEQYVKNNDSIPTIEYSSYYDERIKECGQLIEGLRNGSWKQYYKDGDIRWIGQYNFGIRVIPQLDSMAISNIKIIPKGITSDGYFSYRFSIPDSLCPDDLLLIYANAEFRMPNRFDSTDFELKPKNDKMIGFEIRALQGNEVVSLQSFLLLPNEMKPHHNKTGFSKKTPAIIDVQEVN